MKSCCSQEEMRTGVQTRAVQKEETKTDLQREAVQTRRRREAVYKQKQYKHIIEHLFVVQAVYIMHGSTKPVMSLSQRDQKELWRSVSEGKSVHLSHASGHLYPRQNCISASVPG
jgi:hypothetical protein